MTGHPMDVYFDLLAARRPHARLRVWRRARVGDVIHAPSGPLEVVRAPTQDSASSMLVAVIVDRHTDGEPYERTLAHPPMRDVLLSRPEDAPEHLR